MPKKTYIGKRGRVVKAAHLKNGELGEILGTMYAGYIVTRAGDRLISVYVPSKLNLISTYFPNELNRAFDCYWDDVDSLPFDIRILESGEQVILEN